MLIIFSFVGNYWLAILGRFAFGMVSGLSPICKATLTEILPKSRNAEAIGYASAVWYLGNFAGPFVGGNSLYLLDSYFMLPSLMAGFIVFASWYLVSTFFFETIQDNVNKELGASKIESVWSKSFKNKKKKS